MSALLRVGVRTRSAPWNSLQVYSPAGTAAHGSPVGLPVLCRTLFLIRQIYLTQNVFILSHLFVLNVCPPSELQGGPQTGGGEWAQHGRSAGREDHRARVKSRLSSSWPCVCSCAERSVQQGSRPVHSPVQGSRVPRSRMAASPTPVPAWPSLCCLQLRHTHTELAHTHRDPFDQNVKADRRSAL